MTDRKTALRGLRVGDIFHGRSPNGATTQEDLRFDRDSGIELGNVPSKIDCVAALPPDVHDALVAMDRKGQVLAQMFRGGVEPGLDAYKLSSVERQALQYIEQHTASNPI